MRSERALANLGYRLSDQTVANILRRSKTLPAGTHKVNRVTDTGPRTLILHSFENRTSALVLPSHVEGGSGDKVHVSFERVGGQYFLNKIATADDVFTQPDPYDWAGHFETEAKQMMLAGEYKPRRTRKAGPARVTLYSYTRPLLAAAICDRHGPKARERELPGRRCRWWVNIDALRKSRIAYASLAFNRDRSQSLRRDLGKSRLRHFIFGGHDGSKGSYHGCRFRNRP